MRATSIVMPNRLGALFFAIAIVAPYLTTMSACPPGKPSSQSARRLSWGPMRLDYDAYLAFAEQGKASRKVWTADDISRLWQAAFLLRDLQGARDAATAFSDGSAFWESCFNALANGQEAFPANLNLAQPQDIPATDFGPMLTLFPMKALRESVHPEVRRIAKFIEDEERTVDPSLDEQRIVTPADTCIDARTLGLMGKWRAKGGGEWENQRRVTAAVAAYASCNYKVARAWSKEWRDTCGKQNYTLYSPCGQALPLAYFQGETLSRTRDAITTSGGLTVVVDLDQLRDDTIWWEQLVKLSAMREKLIAVRATRRSANAPVGVH